MPVGREENGYSVTDAFLVTQGGSTGGGEPPHVLFKVVELFGHEGKGTALGYATLCYRAMQVDTRKAIQFFPGAYTCHRKENRDTFFVKVGKVFTRSDFEPYADLIFGKQAS